VGHSRSKEKGRSGGTLRAKTSSQGKNIMPKIGEQPHILGKKTLKRRGQPKRTLQSKKRPGFSERKGGPCAWGKHFQRFSKKKRKTPLQGKRVGDRGNKSPQEPIGESPFSECPRKRDQPRSRKRASTKAKKKMVHWIRKKSAEKEDERTQKKKKQAISGASLRRLGKGGAPTIAWREAGTKSGLRKKRVHSSKSLGGPTNRENNEKKKKKGQGRKRSAQKKERPVLAFKRKTCFRLPKKMGGQKSATVQAKPSGEKKINRAKNEMGQREAKTRGKKTNPRWGAHPETEKNHKKGGRALKSHKDHSKGAEEKKTPGKKVGRGRKGGGRRECPGGNLPQKERLAKRAGPGYHKAPWKRPLFFPPTKKKIELDNVKKNVVGEEEKGRETKQIALKKKRRQDSRFHRLRPKGKKSGKLEGPKGKRAIMLDWKRDLLGWKKKNPI